MSPINCTADFFLIRHQSLPLIFIPICKLVWCYNSKDVGNLVNCIKGYTLSSLVFFIISGVGIWVLRPLTGLLYQPRMIGDGDCGEIGGMKIGRGNWSTRRKPAPAPLCPPQIPHDYTRVWTRAPAMGSQLSNLDYLPSYIASRCSRSDTDRAEIYKACLPVGATALGEAWPPLQPGSTQPARCWLLGFWTK
jgi:hypothetical protein